MSWPKRKKPAKELPPYSLEAERGVLGCVLCVPDRAADALDACGEAGLTWEWFYDLRHQVVWKAMDGLQRAGAAVDVLTVTEWLRGGGEIETAGGRAYVSDLADGAVSPANVPYYLGILKEQWWLRSCVRVGTELAAGAQHIEEGEKTSAAELVARAEREILRLGEQGGERKESRIKEVLRAVLDSLEEYHRGHAQIRGLTTGLEYLDKMLCGVGGENGNYIVLSGRPGTGKSALAVQIVDHVASEYVWFEPVTAVGPDGKKSAVLERVKNEAGEEVERFKVTRHVGVPVGIFSLEMTKQALVRRMLFRRAQADVQRWRTGFASVADFAALGVAAPKLTQPNNVIIEDEGCYAWESVRSKARRWVRQYGCKLFVIDYLQLMESGDRALRQDRVRELGEISKGIQRLGKELQVPFLVLAQMNREVEKDPNRKPRLADLKDCGQVEQDGDVIGFLYEPKLRAAQEEFYESAMTRAYGENDWSKRPRRVNLLLGKARNGPTGDVELLFQKSCTNFLDWNVWLKEQGMKGPALGEGALYREEAPVDGDALPSNEDLGL